MYQSLVVLHHHHHLVVLVFLILAILVNTQGGMEGIILKMISIYLSLMIDDFPPYGYPVVPAPFVVKILPFFVRSCF